MAGAKASRPHMPGYGLAGPKAGEGLFPWRWASEKLDKGRTYFLATSGPDSKPHVMPIWGVWFSNAFFFSTGKQSKKAKNLAANPLCSIVTDIDFKKKPKKGDIKDTVIIEGRAEIISDSRTRKRFSALYQDKYDWDMEGFQEPIYRVRPTKVFGFGGTFTQSATRWRFDD